MTAYQQLYLGCAKHLPDTRPDYLTCGYCAKEFLLSHITLFIAHKAVCGQPATLKDGAESSQDTSSPLTCSFCSRVFLTAQGILQHAEEVHNMRLCIKKGPLMIPDDCISPPPAYVSVHDRDYDVTSGQGSIEDTMESSGGSESDYSPEDQPTDLSMSCSSSNQLRPPLCSHNWRKVTADPRDAQGAAKDPKMAEPSSGLSRQRGFVGGPGSAHAPNRLYHLEHEKIAHLRPNTTYFGSYKEHGGSQGDCGMSGSRPFDIQPDPDVDNLTASEYDSDTVCGVPHNPMTSGERDASNESNNISTKPCHLNPVGGEESGLLDRVKVEAKATHLPYSISPRQLSHSPESARPGLIKVSSRRPGLMKVDSGENDCLVTSSTCTGMATPPTAQIVSLATTTSNSIYPTPSTSFTVSSASPSISTATHSRPQTQNAGKSIYPSHPPPLLWSRSAGFECERTSDPFMRAKSSGDVISEEYQIPKSQQLQHLSKSTSSLATILNTNGHYCTATTLNSNKLFGAMTSPVDFDMRPAHGTRYVEGFNKEAQAYLSRESACKEPSVYRTPASPGCLQHSQRTTSVCSLSSVSPTQLMRSPPKKSMQENSHDSSRGYEPVDKMPTKSSPLRESEPVSPLTSFQGMLRKEANRPLAMSPQERSPIGQPEEFGNKDSNSAIPEDDGQQRSPDGRQLKKRRYPTSKPFKCNHCDQAFNQRIHLKKHMSKHTGVKPFKCPHCEYSTVERSHLKVHFRVHTGEKPFKCKHCDYATAQNSTLKIHLKRHHEELLKTNGHRLPSDNSTVSSQTSVVYDLSQDSPSGQGVRSPHNVSTISGEDRERSVPVDLSLPESESGNKPTVEGICLPSKPSPTHGVNINFPRLSLISQSPSNQNSRENRVLVKPEWYEQGQPFKSSSGLDNVYNAQDVDQTTTKKVESPMLKQMLSSYLNSTAYSSSSAPSHTRPDPIPTTNQLSPHETVSEDSHKTWVDQTQSQKSQNASASDSDSKSLKVLDLALSPTDSSCSTKTDQLLADASLRRDVSKTEEEMLQGEKRDAHFWCDGSTDGDESMDVDHLEVNPLPRVNIVEKQFVRG